MPRAPRLVAVLLGAALGTVACGGDAGTAHCTSRASPTPPSVSSGALTATADRAVVAGGGTVTAGVRVTGPLRYQAPCDAPLQLIVVDRADIHVDSVAPAAPKGTPCGSVDLAAGLTAEYDVSWTADPTLPTGAYRLVLALGDQPQLSVPIRLGLDLGC